MINLSENTNPYYPKKSMIRFIKKNIKKINTYPSKELLINDNNYFNKFNITQKNILVTAGTMDALDLLHKTLKKKKVGYFEPTFWGFSYNSKINNYDITKEKLENDFSYNIKKIDELAKKVDIIYLCNPNNPTLNYISKRELYKIIKNNKKCNFVVDETILLFNNNYDKKTMLPYVNKLNNLSVLVSLSKIFSVSGLRIGLFISNENIINKSRKSRTLFFNNIISEIFINKYINEFNKLNKVRKKISMNLKILKRGLSKKYIDKIIDNKGSFILVKLKETVDYEKFIENMNNTDVRINYTSASYKSLDGNYIRISCCKKRYIRRVVRIINKKLEKSVNNF